jgi:hypothetical protein
MFRASFITFHAGFSMFHDAFSMIHAGFYFSMFHASLYTGPILNQDPIYGNLNRENQGFQSSGEVTQSEKGRPWLTEAARL